MIPDDMLLLVIAAVFFILALAVDIYIGVEVVRILREIIAQMMEGPFYGPGVPGEGELSGGGFAGGRAIMPFRDRETVRRLIKHFEAERAEPPSREEE
jgi:hypothetical protein